MKGAKMRMLNLTKEIPVNVTFTFTGTVMVKATNDKEALQMVERGVDLYMGGTVHTTLPEGMVDWDFPVHPEKNISLRKGA